MTRKAEGRHRANELPVDGAAAMPPSGEGHVPVTPNLPSRYSVQLLDGHWFIGPVGAVQRIEDAQWLANWLEANGSAGHDNLDFAGDRELERRFAIELDIGSRPPPASSAKGEIP